MTCWTPWPPGAHSARRLSAPPGQQTVDEIINCFPNERRPPFEKISQGLVLPPTLEGAGGGGVDCTMAALNKLAHLSLVNKVTTELENHIGIADKTLSEFIIDLAGKHTDPRAFQKALEDAGAELSFDLVRSLLGIIQRMKPGGSKEEAPAGVRWAGARAPRRNRADPPPTIPCRGSRSETTPSAPRR